MESGITRNPNEILAAGNLRLRKFQASDAPAIFDLIDRNREHLSQFGDDTADKYLTLESVTESIVNSKNPERLRFGIWDDGTLVGSINLTPDKDNKVRGEMGYYLGSEFTKKGYMAKAVAAFTDFAFKVWGFGEIYAKVHPENVASQKVLTRFGFKNDGKVKNDLLLTLKAKPREV